MKELVVAPGGRAEGTGDAGSPLDSLERARDRVRQWRREGPVGPVTVWLRGGSYRLARSFVLSAEDGGTAEAPIAYRGWPGEEVRLSGAVAIPAEAVRPAGDAPLPAGIDPAIRGTLAKIDLAALGIADAGGRNPRGFAFPELPADLDLFDGDRPLPIARWPRDGYALTGQVLEAGTAVRDPASGSMGPLDPSVKPSGASFKGDPERIRRWSRPRDLLCFGMWAYDWAPATVPVSETDSATGRLTLTDPCFGGVLEGRAYCVLNAVEEITEPGDWAVDREARILYLLPPRPARELNLAASALTEPLAVVKGARHVVLRNLVFEGGRGHGLTVDGENILVAGCTFRNLGGRAVNVEGRNNRVQACHIHATGQGGIRIAGGDRRALVPSGHVVDNNEIHDFNRVCMTYNAAVWPMGCGHRIAHNLIYDGPHNAILMHGNDHVVEYNEIHHMAMVCDDAAAFYMGRNPGERGNVLRHNYFHHIGAPTGWGTSAIYPDDGSSGLRVYGNVFYRCGHAGQVCMGAFFNNGGKDHVIENNVFVDCRIAVGLMLMTPSTWEELVREDAAPDTVYTRSLYRDIDIRSAAYRARYPELAELAARACSSTIRRNLMVRCGVAVTPEDRQVVEDNWSTAADPGFADLACLDFTLLPDSEAFRRIPGFEPVPFRDMGLIRDDCRPTLPARREVDCRPELAARPAVRRPGDLAPARLLLHFFNPSDAAIVVRAEPWASHPEVVKIMGTVGRVSLAPREVRTETVALEVTARPDLQPQVGVRLTGSPFTLPVPVRPCYRVGLSLLPEPPDLALVGAALSGALDLPFLSVGRRVGAVRLAAAGGFLVVSATFDDGRPLPEKAEEGMWNGPLFGLLAAPAGAADVSTVRQPVFFPHGPGVGTLWFFEGPRRTDPDAGIRWTVRARPGGWDFTGLVPLAALGLRVEDRRFRLEAMANLVSPGEAKPTLTTLFGSKPARLEMETLAEVTVS